MGKTGKPLPSGAYPNQHDPRDLYRGDPPSRTADFRRSAPRRPAAHRKLSDYCGILAEKTKIGRNVESFMQSRGLLPRSIRRRSIDETPRRGTSRHSPVATANGNVAPVDRETRENHHHRRRHRHRHADAEQNGRERPRGKDNAAPRTSRVGYFWSDAVACPPMRTGGGGGGLLMNHENVAAKSRRYRRREYEEQADYDDSVDGWKRDVANGRPRVADSRPIFSGSGSGSSIDRTGDERPRYSTLPPRRSRTINFQQDRARGSSDGRATRAYPKSLQDLTDLELGERTLQASHRDRESPRRGAEQSSLFNHPDDNYLRLCRNLSRLDGYPRASRYEPGEVHYERECRTFGKDTIAFIYYKTCYL